MHVFLQYFATQLAEFHARCALTFLQNKKGSPSKEVGTLRSDDLRVLAFLRVVRLPALAPLGDSLDDSIYTGKALAVDSLLEMEQ